MHKLGNFLSYEKSTWVNSAGHCCGCMLAKQMGGYSDRCVLSGKGHVMCCYQK